MLPVYISHPDCLKHSMGDQHPECPERLGAVNDMLLIKGLLDFMQPMDAPLATEKQLAQAHASLYIHELAAQSPKEGTVQVDPDTSMNPYTYQAALRAAGAAVLATDVVLTKGAGTAFCNVRPPGHHAEYNAAGGFCFFNNVAVGIRHALNVHGLERVALVDFDVHHGNGSEDILHDDERVLMCSIFEDKLYPFCGNVPRGPNMVNVALPARSGSEPLRQAVLEKWIPALDQFRPQLIFISAGFDGHRDDDMGNLGLVEADYAWITKQIVAVAQRHCQGRIVSCLEGGYVMSSLARSAAAHVKVLLGMDD
ncbi:histone deacetylase family protein [Duganella qianjiadongensis]|uniref:Histone deacetylase family protein n=1 Tax=Duganella qianjiadongensis TaxID=2692176 RepID=A0ABW9VQR2_9BURK|nr:histone deacetylase family protein [Duganella qianjiadongensis]MYM41741.1 histone deacetylase family protein [Duganella qianjiadongensis]